MLNDRDSAVLAAVVELGLKNGEPVGAAPIARMKRFGLCPASIRNILARLEKEGYLFQPHASSGREPTDKGYMYYARRLAPAKRLSKLASMQIDSALEDPLLPETASRLDALSRAVSRLSSQVALAGVCSAGSAPIREYRFIQLGRRRAGAVMATMGGELLRQGFAPEWEVTGHKLEGLAAYFNEKASFMTLPQARRLFFRESMGAPAGSMAKDACAVAQALEDGMAAVGEEMVFVEGVQNLFAQVSGEEDIALLKAAGAALGEKKKLMLLLDQLAREPGESVMVGGQSRIEEFFGCSVVAHPFAGPHGVEGAVGVIGKKRMDYGLARALVSHAARRLTISLGGAERWS